MHFLRLFLLGGGYGCLGHSVVHAAELNPHLTAQCFHRKLAGSKVTANVCGGMCNIEHLGLAECFARQLRLVVREAEIERTVQAASCDSVPLRGRSPPLCEWYPSVLEPLVPAFISQVHGPKELC